MFLEPFIKGFLKVSTSHFFPDTKVSKFRSKESYGKHIKDIDESNDFSSIGLDDWQREEFIVLEESQGLTN